MKCQVRNCNSTEAREGRVHLIDDNVINVDDVGFTTTATTRRRSKGTGDQRTCLDRALMVLKSERKIKIGFLLVCVVVVVLLSRSF
jgi:hypothetical protein